MKVLVTGATGGIGELVVNTLLAKGINVIATSRDTEKARTFDFFSKVNYKPYDINSRSPEDLYTYFDKPDKVIHLAWEKLNEYNNDAHLTTILENHKAFASNLFKHGLKDLTSVGTCYEYGLREGVLEETMPASPVLPYPQAKNLFHLFLEGEKAKYGVSLKWVRVFYVFGEVKGRKNLYNLLVNAVKQGDKLFNMSGGEQVRDFLTPSEIAENITAIALQNKTEGTINCCSGKPVKLKTYIKEFLDKNNYSLELNLGFFPYPNYEPMNTWGSVEKLNRAIGIENKFDN